jgi:hypothetical protein
MDQILVLLDARVADAAEAWLADPRDAGVYARLVAAIGERRRHLDAAAAATPEPTEHPADDEPDAGLEESAAASIRPVGEALVGDPRVALERLRRGQAR